MTDQFAKKDLIYTISKEVFSSVNHLCRKARELDITNWKHTQKTTQIWQEYSHQAKGFSQFYQKISNHLSQFNQKPAIISLLKKHQSAFIQLKTRMGYIKSYFKKIRKAENNRCFGRCSVKQDTFHLILECRNHSKERKLMIAILRESGLPFILQILFETKVGKEMLVEFLVNSGICITK